MDFASIERYGINAGLGYHEDVAPDSIRVAVEIFKNNKASRDLTTWKASRLTDVLDAVRITELMEDITGGRVKSPSRMDECLKEVGHA